VDGRNELTNWPTGPCAYDADGNLTNKTFASGGRVLSYAYDDEDRLTQVADNVSYTFRTLFVYDGIGRLRSRLEYSWVTNSGNESADLFTRPLAGTGGGGGGSGGTWQLATNISYIYDGKRVIQERNGATPLVAYTRGNDLTQTLEGAGGIGGLLARSVGNGSGGWASHAYYHADGNGNITYLETSAQGLGASYEYDPYGNLYTYSGSLAAGNVYRFSSKECHLNSGMYYYLYRFYDPELQRWVNRDPLHELGGINLYGFVANCPIGYFDSDGRWITIAIGAGVGAIWGGITGGLTGGFNGALAGAIGGAISGGLIGLGVPIWAAGGAGALTSTVIGQLLDGQDPFSNVSIFQDGLSVIIGGAASGLAGRLGGEVPGKIAAGVASGTLRAAGKQACKLVGAAETAGVNIMGGYTNRINNAIPR